jgi:hypothetical protein
MSPWIGKTRQLGAYFFLSLITRIAYWRNESSCVVRWCAANRKKIREISLEIIDAANLDPIAYWRRAGIPTLNSSADFFNSLWRPWRRTVRRDLPIRQNIAYWFCFTGAETEINKIKDDGKIKRRKNLYRRGPRQFLSFATFPTPLHSRYRLYL